MDMHGCTKNAARWSYRFGIDRGVGSGRMAYWPLSGGGAIFALDLSDYGRNELGERLLDPVSHLGDLGVAQLVHADPRPKIGDA